MDAHRILHQGKPGLSSPEAPSSVQPSTEDVEERQAVARLRLGRLMKERRKDLNNVTQLDVANEVGWTQQRYAQLEKGTGTTRNVEAWVRIAEALQLPPKFLLEKVADTTDDLVIRVPPAGDGRRAVLLEIVIDQFAEHGGGAP